MVQQERRRHPQHQLEERGDEGVDERVLEGLQEDGVVQVDAEVLEPDEVARPPHHLVGDRQPEAERERIGDEHEQDQERGGEEHPASTAPARGAGPGFSGRARGSPRVTGAGATAMAAPSWRIGVARMVGRDPPWLHAGQPAGRAPGEPGRRGQATRRPSSARPRPTWRRPRAFMPLMAWAYMSTMMYFTSASDAFRLGGPGHPLRPN